MNWHNKLMLAGVGIAAIIAVAVAYLHTKTFALLQPAGPIAAQEKHLLIIAVLLMLIIVIPVFVLLLIISLRYRASNDHRARYTPDWDRHAGYETVWWAIPTLLIGVLSVITWTSSHALDPSRALVSTTRPLTIQVVALEWKWLFIYPEQHIASVNYVAIPENTPINFQITSDATMNSFWIPQLGGQIYAMAGMTTQLHLMADRTGNFRGNSANISGKGFAGMNFMAHATTPADFAAWASTTKRTAAPLDLASYAALAEPSQNTKPTNYSLQAQGLYDTIVEKSAGPGINHGMDMSAGTEGQATQ